jgi:hypothetical protein
VQFNLSAPALVVVIGLGSSQGTLAFSGLDNPTIDVPSPSSDSGTEDLSVEHEYLGTGTYTIQETTGPTPGSSPENEVDLIGVLILSDQPDTATSTNPQIPIDLSLKTAPTSPDKKTNTSGHIPVARYLSWSVAGLVIIGMALVIFRLIMPRRGNHGGSSSTEN